MPVKQKLCKSVILLVHLKFTTILRFSLCFQYVNSHRSKFQMDELYAIYAHFREPTSQHFKYASSPEESPKNLMEALKIPKFLAWEELNPSNFKNYKKFLHTSNSGQNQKNLMEAVKIPRF